MWLPCDWIFARSDETHSDLGRKLLRLDSNQ